MSDKHTEDLYAFIDGELGDHETRFLLKSLDHNQALRDKWTRFHYSRAMLHEPASTDASALAHRISLALSDEALPEQIRHSKSQGWLKPLAGMAVAATVVFAAFNYLQLDSAQSPVSTLAELDDRSSRSPQIIDESQPMFSPSASTVSAEWDPKLQTYLMRHTQISSRTQAKNLMPYIHVISTPVTSEATPERADDELEAERSAPSR